MKKALAVFALISMVSVAYSAGPPIPGSGEEQDETSSTSPPVPSDNVSGNSSQTEEQSSSVSETTEQKSGNGSEAESQEDSSRSFLQELLYAIGLF